VVQCIDGASITVSNQVVSHIVSLMFAKNS